MARPTGQHRHSAPSKSACSDLWGSKQTGLGRKGSSHSMQYSTWTNWELAPCNRQANHGWIAKPCCSGSHRCQNVQMMTAPAERGGPGMKVRWGGPQYRGLECGWEGGEAYWKGVWESLRPYLLRHGCLEVGRCGDSMACECSCNRLGLLVVKVVPHHVGGHVGRQNRYPDGSSLHM